MGPPKTLRFVVLGVVFSWLCSPEAGAQLPWRLERCLPYPTLQQEIRDVLGKRPKQKVVVASIEFKGAVHLPDSRRRQLVAALKRREFDGNSGWLEEFKEEVRAVWQDHGYFNAEVKAEARALKGDSASQRVSIAVEVEEGLQYRLGEIRFVLYSGDARGPLFALDQLRNSFRLRDGEILNVAKIRVGIDTLNRMYIAKGYIEFVAIPDTNTDEVRQRISVVLELVEGPQFRVGQVKTLGLHPSTENLLRSKLKPGDTFDYRIVERFIEENKRVLPSDASSEDVFIFRDSKNHTVDFVFDFRTCKDFSFEPRK